MKLNELKNQYFTKPPKIMQTQEKNVFLTRFEAFALYKYYTAKSDESKEADSFTLAQIYLDKAQDWLDKACEIEATNSDQVSEQMPKEILFSITQ
jgi:hypothetical protein